MVHDLLLLSDECMGSKMAVHLLAHVHEFSPEVVCEGRRSVRNNQRFRCRLQWPRVEAGDGSDALKYNAN